MALDFETTVIKAIPFDVSMLCMLCVCAQNA